MAGAFVAQRENSAGATSQSAIALTANYTPTAGNLVIIAVAYFRGTQATVNMPSAWGTFVEGGHFFNGTDGCGIRWGIYQNVSASASNASVSFSGGDVDFPAIYVAEWSGLLTASALVANPVGNRQAAPGTGAGAITVSATPSSQPAIVFGLSLCIGAADDWDTAVSDTGRARVFAYGGGTFFAKPQDARVTSTSAKTLTWTTDDGGETYYSIAMALAEAASGGTTTTKTMTETFTLADAALDPTFRVRQMSDATAFTDAEVHWTHRYRVLSDAIDVVDSFVKSVILGSGVFVKVMTDTLTVPDSVVMWLRRVRDQIESVTVTDGDAYRTSVVTGTEAFEVADGFVTWRRLKRVMGDDLDLIDGFSKTLSGAGITYARVMSDTVTLIDDAGQRWRMRVSQLTDGVGLSDQVVQYLRRIRELGDDVEFSDGTVKVRRSTRSLDESFEVSDGQVATLFLDQISNTSFSFGSSAPPFRFGGL